VYFGCFNCEKGKNVLVKAFSRVNDKKKTAQLNALIFGSKPVIAVVFPETSNLPGGGYIRFYRIQKYLQRNFEFLFVTYKSYTDKAKIIELLFALFIPIKMIKRIREKQAVAVLVVNEFITDVIIGYLLSSLLNLKFIVFMNSEPVKGLVGFGESKKSEKSIIIDILNSVKEAGLHPLLTIFSSFVFSLMILFLRKAIVIPLAPHLSVNLKQLGLKVLPIYPGVGCYPQKIEGGGRWIDALYVASLLHPHKGVFDVLEVWEKVVKHKPSAILLVLGRESSFFSLDILKDIVRRKKLEKNIFIISRKENIPNNFILKLMSQAKIFVYPSKKDVCPLVIGEALSQGTPVITYDLPGIKFAYSSCQAVLTVPTGDINKMATHVMELLDNSLLTMTYSKIAIEWCSANSWEKVSLREAKAYLKALITS
jgi:glycosyltransferase involved in cell wall biosynthesis